MEGALASSATSEGILRIRQPFTSPANYAAYVARTNEKALLHEELIRAFYFKELPIQPGDSGKRILDLGCGLGTNTQLLLNLFPHHDVIAIDNLPEMVDFALAHLLAPRDNLVLERVAFEDFRGPRFDFILCSHVLQYISTPLTAFLKKMMELLEPGGEAWIVLQERRGLNQLIVAGLEHVRRVSPYFEHWFTHGRVRRLLLRAGHESRILVMPSSFQAPHLASLTVDDVAFLNFVYLDGFDPNNHSLLSAIDRTLRPLTCSGLVRHDVGITKVRRRMQK